MRLNLKYYLAGFLFLALTIPAGAHTFKEPLDITKAEMIGGEQLSPGSYELKADDTAKELSILQKGKVIMTVHGEWVKMQQKADYLTVLTDGDKITQVQFTRSEQAFKLQ